MRLIVPILLLALSACDRDSAPSNGQAALERRERPRPQAATPTTGGEKAPGAVAGAGTPGATETEAPAAAPAPPAVPQQAEAQTSPAAHPAPVAAPAAQPAASTERGRALVEAKCSTCHSLEVALAHPRSAAGWAEMVEVMMGHGMDASAAERRLMLNYLETRR